MRECLETLMHGFPISYGHTEWYLIFSRNDMIEMVEESPAKANYNNNTIAMAEEYCALDIANSARTLRSWTSLQHFPLTLNIFE